MYNHIFISEHDNVYIPEKYHSVHNLCVRLYDQLLEILVDKHIHSKAKVWIDLNTKNAINPFPAEANTDIQLDWMLQNGFSDKVDCIISRSVFWGIIRDLTDFIHQIFDSTRRMKLTVAYSLMRKPFLENLIILEQLFVNEKEFLKNYRKNPKDFDPGNIADDEKMGLITLTCKKLYYNTIWTPEIIFDMRYNKSNINSLYAVTNLAIHLVTTRHSKFKTDSQNLNLIFSSEEDLDSQLQHIYYWMPLLLSYLLDVADNYLLSNKLIKLNVFKGRLFTRNLYQFYFHDQRNNRKGSHQILKLFKFSCSECNHINMLNYTSVHLLINSGKIFCKNCSANIIVNNPSFDKLVQVAVSPLNLLNKSKTKN